MVCYSDMGFLLIIGVDCIIGYCVILYGCIIEDGVLIGMGVIILNGVCIGVGLLIGVGVLVVEGKEILFGLLVMGVLGCIVCELDVDVCVVLLKFVEGYCWNVECFWLGLKFVEV